MIYCGRWEIECLSFKKIISIEICLIIFVYKSIGKIGVSYVKIFIICGKMNNKCIFYFMKKVLMCYIVIVK